MYIHVRHTHGYVLQRFRRTHVYVCATDSIATEGGRDSGAYNKMQHLGATSAYNKMQHVGHTAAAPPTHK